ncbi:c-terminal kinesin [Ustilago trichophora]|uniref:C-terminal kinesin n=1 Tax=Ustilago trichophora TaxID=86804 RepID=A0A5C3EM55_9BASI|nr:c-terminal kinesin [Ustilago trichophora]
MSSIPVPQTVKRQRSAATLPGTAGPSKIREPAAGRAVPNTRSVSTVDSGRFVPARRTVATTLPRAPMTNTTNRPGVGATTRSVSASSKIASGAALAGGATVRRGVTSVTRLRPGTNSAVAASSSRTSNGSVTSVGSTDVDPSRMDAMESRLASMAELFELERQKTEEKWNKERSERLAQEDKVRQLEEDLIEQRKIAQSKQDEIKRRRTLADDEVLQLTAKFNRDKRMLETELEQERETVAALKATLNQQSTSHLTMESTNAALRSQIQVLQDEIEALRAKMATMDKDLTQTKEANLDLENELREAESLRRKLHNEVQELRGNIRVFCRVRPPSNNDVNNGIEALATIRFPNEREANQIELLAAGESALGTVTMRNHLFTFDRVFQPTASQADVFEEIAHLTQSVLDGYNTSIFAYGQTGSGKTHTLEGAPDSITNFASDPSADEGAGLIPRAVQMLWSTAESLKDKGWKYDFQGSMLEIYLDNINDLLGKTEVDKAKHEIKHDKGRTTVSDTVVVPLDSPAQVFALLEKAKKRRQVAATLMNERSSRSHSVFMLRVRGQNATTMEACDAVLSLVDLAGSERLANSGSDKDPIRLKEAQSINKSLSSLADVISALGQNKSSSSLNHIPYRNSTLTWLLKNSLGGNSKTLMLLALSPMAAHLNESLCSLRFATKVNSTTIGTAKAIKSIAN